MCTISREEAAWRRGASGGERAGRSGETQETPCGSSVRETGNAGGARACILNGNVKGVYHSDLSSFGTVQSALGVGGCGREIFASTKCQLQFAKASAATLPQQEKNDTADVQREKSTYARLYRYSGKLALAPMHLRRARVVGRSSAAGAQPLAHVCTVGACGKKNSAWASSGPAGLACGGMLRAMARIAPTGGKARSTEALTTTRGSNLSGKFRISVGLAVSVGPPL
jgi:hypothetical protein